MQKTGIGKTGFNPFVKSAALAAVLTVASVGAYAQKSTVSDAQVQSNVIKALAGEPKLAREPITASTAFGTVTLSGAVTDPANRDLAEQIVARTEGVKRVVDQVTVGGQAAPDGQSADVDPAARNTLPDAGQQAANDNDANMQQGQAQPGDDNGQAQNQQQPAYSGQNQQPGYNDPNQQPNGNDGQNGPPRRLYRRDYERQMAARQGNGDQGDGQQQGGQVGGQQVIVPAGQVVDVRIDRWLSSGDAQPGMNFDAIVMNDIVAGGAIAVPRGAQVQGTVLDAKGAGVLKGRGTLTLQLTNVTLGGRVFPLVSEPWTINGHDKTARTVNSALGLGALGAIIGGVAGGGAGAAIGAGVGGAAGIGTSAASGGGQAVVPGEAPISFRLEQQTQVVTVGQAELARLSQAAGPSRGYGPPPRYAPYPPYGYPVYGYPVVGIGYGYPYGGYYGRPYYYGYSRW